MNNLPLQPLVWFGLESTNRLICEVVTPICEYSVWKDVDSVAYSVLYYNRHTEAPTKEATGFATIDEAKAWAWKHYNEKMQPYVKPDSITDIRNWFKAAKPEPTFNDYMTQLGCHFEEVCEMMAAIGGGNEDICIDLSEKADFIKGLTVPDEYVETQKTFIDNTELLDALCDQIVTATGVAYMMGFDIEGALKEVIRSNNSKMVKGKFEFDANGKIMKPDSYSEPDLTPFVKQGE
ncbi:hypothetical protein FQV37_2218 [Psychrobacter nivimaris]|uniref:Uncharacterized protein n=1 Tax=Psychrobacter nivimaris TaxID=281738 RepID=A0A6N7BWQ8_9GAMM|nr:nucleoside triphosphate pyrophosphohydrolase family protein [Psychrobacter nivimaris]KAF0567472.1 hypothetical protein FQV37_2218 [Psychrobacter nivimaris]